MSITKFHAPLVFTADGKFTENTVVIADDGGTILSVETQADHDPASLKSVAGAIVPGFINTHCHLELSHMKGLVPSGTTLLPFLKSVVQFRNFPDEEIEDAIRSADADMYAEGIVAVGDISNKTDTAPCKAASKMRYYTFVEMFDFLNPANTAATIALYSEIFLAHASAAKDKKSFVPHAPYTVSTGLFEFIRRHNEPGSTVSIHNQETPVENEFFQHGTGGFFDFYRDFGIDLSSFRKTGKTAIHYALENMDAQQKTLFVHNTTSTRADVEAAMAWSSTIYWATCANANLYIENNLPDYRNFMDQKMTIGTDSLTSNWQLSVWEEIRTIHKYNAWISLETLFKWATLNGAEALGFQDEIGCISPGKRPGLISCPVMDIQDKLHIMPGNVHRLL